MADEDIHYTSSITPRTGYTRHATSSGGSSRVLKIVTEMGSHTVTGLSSTFGAGAASAIMESREREKKDMQDLNDRLAGYIEKVRFLEAQNRKLAADLDALRGRWGKDTSNIKQMYEGELSEARRLIDQTSKDKAALENQISRLQQDLAEYRRRYEETNRLRDGDKEKIEGLHSQLSDAEAEISLLRRRIQTLEDDVSRLRSDNNRLLNELQKARSDLDQETLNRIDYQNQVQTLLEEIDFINRVHDQEIRELQALASRDTTTENREYFRNELAMAIRDIRNEYEDVSARNKVDMESWYKLKVQEIQASTARTTLESSYSKEETKRLRTQLGDLRGKLGDLESRNSLLEKQVKELSYQLEDDQRQYEAALNDRDAQIRKMREECQSLMVELQMLLDTKQTLDAEIAIYRKMLEGEENRGGLKQLVDEMVRTHSIASQEDLEGGGDITTHGSKDRRVSYHKKTQQEGQSVTVEERYREDPDKNKKSPTGSQPHPGEGRDRDRDKGSVDRGKYSTDRDGDRGSDRWSTGDRGGDKSSVDKGGDRTPTDRWSTGDRGGDKWSSGDRGGDKSSVDKGGDRTSTDRWSSVDKGSIDRDGDRSSVTSSTTERPDRGSIKSTGTTSTGGARRTGDEDDASPSKYGHIKQKRPSETSSTIYPGFSGNVLRHDGFGDINDGSRPSKASVASVGSVEGSRPSKASVASVGSVDGSRSSKAASPDEEKHDSFEESMRVVKGEMATRTSFQRSAKGNVSIAECHPEGKYIVLENTHRSKDESLDEWKLKRRLDGKREFVYTMPDKFVLRAGKSVKIWAKNQGGTNNPPDQLVFAGEETWGTGHNVQTMLYNKEGEERATHIQRTSQQTSATT